MINFSRIVLCGLAAFSLCSAQAAKSSRYILQDSILTVKSHVTTIKPHEFEDRTDLKQIVFESGCHITAIGDFAFMGCSNLRQIDIPETVSELGQGCFRECTSLTGLTIPQRITVIPRELCEWCKSLQSVILPNGIKDIQAHAFAYCKSLQSLQLPSGLSHIGSNAFAYCKALQSIKIPERLQELESYAFAECTSLSEATLPSVSNMLGELIFSGCSSLTVLRAPSAVPPKFDCDSSIFEPWDNKAFQQCTLIVPSASLPAYRKSPGWKEFQVIIGLEK